jgi:ribosomal-protein-alanine N-acetyltransferase
MQVHIRWLVRHDMAEVLQIEKWSFEHPWQEDDFLRALRQTNCIGMVAERDGLIVGFFSYTLHKDKIHLLDFAVHPDYRLQQVGSQMIDKLTGKLHEQRRNRLVLEVRESNLDAQVFFRRVGFKATKVIRDFYDDSREDAYQLEWRLKARTEPKPLVLEDAS